MKRNYILNWLIALAVVVFLFAQSRVGPVSALLVFGLIAIPSVYGVMLWKSLSVSRETRLELSTVDNET